MRNQDRRRKNEEYLAFAEEFMKNSENAAASQQNQVQPKSSVSNVKTVMMFDGEANPQPQAGAQAATVQGAEQPKQRVKSSSIFDQKTELFFDDLPVLIGASSVIGRREYQQDSIIVPKDEQIMQGEKPKFICVLSDGMGGLTGGEIASKLATERLFGEFYKTVWKEDKPSYLEFFSKTANVINEEILALEDDEGNPMRAGATLIAVIVDGNEMHFVNIGDSRIYLMRDGKMWQLTHDQNFLSVLMEKVKTGEMDREEALTHPKKEALISYCGIKELKLKEINIKPVEMKQDDVIMLCSDGLYRLVSEDEMVDILTNTSGDMNLAAYKLITAANNKNHRGQDNTSVILIKFN